LAIGYWLLAIGYWLLDIAVAVVRRNSPSAVGKTTKMHWRHPAALRSRHPLAVTPVPAYPRALSLALCDLQCCLPLLRPLHLPRLLRPLPLLLLRLLRPLPLLLLRLLRLLR
jgi:hypothetical protein